VLETAMAANDNPLVTAHARKLTDATRDILIAKPQNVRLLVL
jgi:hypothetical protein